MEPETNFKLPQDVLEAAQQTGLLDTEPEDAFDRLAALAGRLAGAPTALLTVLDHDRQFLKSTIGAGEALEHDRETPLSHSFCKFVAGTIGPSSSQTLKIIRW
jgi:hypothetical protein